MDRRAAKAEWKEKKPDAGIYALRIGGRVWVGAAMRLGAAESRMGFAARMGGLPNAEAQAAYAAAGELAFEVLETFDEEISQMKRERLLKERLAHWVEELGAGKV
ncbi:GIY-YIG nuclease family protein [Pseudoruegeria sp. HB172150]|uniref:GIY-YIG nuclease family protein n=1 Tax=Pseudoruegeria sp. HB172150 TaxID=2721164 RepID=UPI0015530CEC|nr:GIY-YIG nuclease family protein [Pseudoruegeria sp. HB172150]